MILHHLKGKIQVLLQLNLLKFFFKISHLVYGYFGKKLWISSPRIGRMDLQVLSFDFDDKELSKIPS